MVLVVWLDHAYGHPRRRNQGKNVDRIQHASRGQFRSVRGNKNEPSIGAERTRSAFADARREFFYNWYHDCIECTYREARSVFQPPTPCFSFIYQRAVSIALLSSLFLRSPTGQSKLVNVNRVKNNFWEAFVRPVRLILWKFTSQFLVCVDFLEFTILRVYNLDEILGKIRFSDYYLRYARRITNNYTSSVRQAKNNTKIY